MLQTVDGKLKTGDERLARLFTWMPWFASLAVSIPIPVIFLALYLGTANTESAAIYLFLSFISLGFGLVAALLVLIFLLLYRKRWHGRLRDRLAADGITANEVKWFTSELSSAERAAWSELQQKNPLLADAYAETLATRLTATRIIRKAREGILRIERQRNRAGNIGDIDTSSLLNELSSDSQRLELLKRESTVRLAAARAQLQIIEAAASRTLDQEETALMLQRLEVSQQHVPLSLEIANLERQMLSESKVPHPNHIPRTSGTNPVISKGE